MRRMVEALDKGWIATSCGLLAPLVVAVVLVPFRTNFSLPASALVLVLVVVAVGSFGSRFAGLVAALSAAAWFDFFLTKPYETFNITYRPDLQTEISLLVVGLAVTEIAARSRGESGGGLRGGRQHRPHPRVHRARVLGRACRCRRHARRG